ncbi:penicillin-binding protein 1C [Gemmatirosa kalamazoonensis]|uniref:penicillin-binding protein 1C n=1 Tax=Gemmatirosa kalamazoonensis TaxID=861299 RepID=UPI00130E45A5|nr:penicillin-binding protein 1C [Gemmatirosa kalamazoonensis]
MLRATRAADGTDASWVPYDRIDPDVITAFVAVEDRRFWEHHGIDARAVLRAAWRNVRARRVSSGASTITMQLARLLRPRGRSAAGKVAQALWALRLEAHVGKQRILEEYLNRVQLGQGTAGVGAASAAYFGASASELSLAQAALLAGIAHAPSRDNPHASPARARAARLLALRRLRRLGLTDSETVARARVEPLVVPPRVAPFLAPHFTTRVLAWSTADRRGAPIRTSLDLGLQMELEGEVRHTVDMLGDRGVRQAAAVVLDNASGEVLAWVGSPDFWSSDDGQTDMVMSPRQPGSALKPFLYGLAFDRGYTAATVLPDVPKAYPTATGPYAPRDYDRRFRGPVRAREALASSYNVPAVELASRLGAGALLQTLHLAGFASLGRDAEHYGLGLALGNGDVTLVELANGYRALANGGVWRPWTWRAGAAGEPRRVLSPLASALVLDILQDASARIPGFGVSTPFDFPFPVAVKTGTSRHFTDNWAVGATARFTVAVWAGNFSGQPMQGVSGVTGAGPLLHRAVMAASRRVSPGTLPSPESLGAERVAVCRLSGLRATDACARLDEWFAPGTAPTRADDWERGGVVVLPDEYAAWARNGAHPAGDGPTLPATRPGTRAVPATRAASLGISRFRILSPLDGDRYAIPVGVEARYATIGLRAAGPGAAHVTWTVDGVRHDGERWALVPGAHEIVAASARGDTARARVEVTP